MRLFIRPFALSLLALALLGTPSVGNAQNQPVAEEVVLAPAVENTVRGGLPNVLARLKKGEEVRIGYLGGSITAAAGWRVKSLKWLQHKYPTARLSEINAAIGGTGSDLGVFRVQRDVLDAKPDLLFVEFAVNDGGAPPAQIERCMEGIVRQTWKVNPSTDICFVYTLSDNMLPSFKDGKYPRAASVMEKVAAHYNIPSIHFGVEVAKLVEEGKVIFKGEKKPEPGDEGPIVFSTDGVHPLVETGHELYLQAIMRSWPMIIGTGAPAPHELIAPLRADNWENAKLVPLEQSMLKGEWSKLDPEKDARAKSYKNRLPALWKATAAGAQMEFTVQGSVVSIYDLVGPDGGALEVQVDDEPVKPVNRIDGYCTYHRLSKLGVLNKETPGQHRIKITLTATSPDKAKILFEHNRPDLEKNPDKYKDNVWYAGGILVLGDLVK